MESVLIWENWTFGDETLCVDFPGKDKYNGIYICIWEMMEGAKVVKCW